jgi:pimeloyl-[acyl-carrier protein] methyl ester esterase
LISQIIWSHGWGFDASFFKPLCHALPEYDHLVIDWGYFGQKHLPKPYGDQPLIGIGHSLGFAKLLELDFPFSRLISLGGFTRFCQTDEFEEGMSQRVLQRMQTKFKKNPQQVLIDFQVSCGYSHPILPVESINEQLLQADLDKLMTVALLLPSIPCLAIAGLADQVCPLPQQQTLFSSVKIMSGEHNFPQVSPFETAKTIQNFLRDII